MMEHGAPNMSPGFTSLCRDRQAPPGRVRPKTRKTMEPGAPNMNPWLHGPVQGQAGPTGEGSGRRSERLQPPGSGPRGSRHGFSAPLLQRRYLHRGQSQADRDFFGPHVWRGMDLPSCPEHWANISFIKIILKNTPEALFNFKLYPCEANRKLFFSFKLWKGKEIIRGFLSFRNSLTLETDRIGNHVIFPK